MNVCVIFKNPEIDMYIPISSLFLQKVLHVEYNLIESETSTEFH